MNNDFLTYVPENMNPSPHTKLPSHDKKADRWVRRILGVALVIGIAVGITNCRKMEREEANEKQKEKQKQIDAHALIVAGGDGLIYQHIEGGRVTSMLTREQGQLYILHIGKKSWVVMENGFPIETNYIGADHYLVATNIPHIGEEVNILEPCGFTSGGWRVTSWKHDYSGTLRGYCAEHSGFNTVRGKSSGGNYLIQIGTEFTWAGNDISPIQYIK